MMIPLSLIRSFFCALVILCLSPFAVAKNPEVVRILRDPWGVPHVLAATDYGALYGYGWAVSEDQLENVLSALWTAQGRRSEIDGEEMIPFDRTMRLMRVTADAERDFQKMPDNLQVIARGFADGINAYMEAHPEEVPSWAEPVSPSWSLGLGRLACFVQQISRANRDLDGLAPKLASLSKNTSDEHFKLYGSNAFALAPKRMEDGVAVHATDPHLPWKYEFRLHEMHLRGETFEVAGAAFIGVLMPVMGRNAHVAWTYTSNRPDHADVYKLKLARGKPGRYIFDGKSIPFEREEVVYRLPDGSSRTEELFWSKHGPVTHRNLEKNYAVAYRLTAFNQTLGPEQFYLASQARDIDELDRAMGLLQVGHFNLLSADTSGNIQFVSGGRIPKRRSGYDYRKPLDGSTSRNLWDEEDVIAWDDLPRVRNPKSNFVQNCNNRPEATTGTRDDPDPRRYPPGVVEGGRVETIRSWYLTRRLNESKVFSRDQIVDIATDGYMIPHGTMIPLLERAWKKYRKGFDQSEEIADSVELLLNWDGQPDPMSPAPTLFTVWLYKYGNEEVFLPVSLMETTPRELGQEMAQDLFEALVRAQNDLSSRSPFAQIPWGLIHVIRRNYKPIPVASGMYPAISLMNANLDFGSSGITDMTCRVGSAYVSVSFMGDPIETHSILPLGETDRRDLPYVDTMTELYAQRKLKPLPFTDEQLAKVETTETLLTIE